MLLIKNLWAKIFHGWQVPTKFANVKKIVIIHIMNTENLSD